ncbi:hypothetical protein S40288_00807 [Stachybotrys chartarum IBT 40288]|nr:hypothetical protein S40288_00807 [Stachybotrys chartarum IBT 40288]
MFLSRAAFLAFTATVVVAQTVDDLATVLENNSNLTTFTDLIRRYPDFLLRLPSANGVTIIAPSNAAFENIPYTALNEVWDPEDEDTTLPLMLYHVLRGSLRTSELEVGPTYVRPTLLTDPTYTNVTSGQNIILNNQPGDVIILTSGLGTRCTLVERDIEFEGGVIQMVDNLLIPPARLERTAEAFSVSSFLGGLYAADVMPAVASRRNITVFAPQDVALAAVGGTLENLDDEALARVMGYHVIPDRVLVSSALSNGTSLDTLGNSSLVIRQSGNNKYVNSAQIVQPDILLANGILHLISNVLNPDNEAVPDPEAATQPPVFPVSLAEDPFTSAIPCTSDCPVTTTPGAENTPGGPARTSATATSSLSTDPSDAAAPARCTAHVAAAAVGAMGLGAGLAWL